MNGGKEQKEGNQEQKTKEFSNKNTCQKELIKQNGKEIRKK